MTIIRPCLAHGLPMPDPAVPDSPADYRARCEQLAAIVEYSGDAIIAYRPDGTVTFWNAGAERVLGYAAAQMLGQSLSRLLPQGAEDQWPALLAAFTGSEGTHRIETTWQRRDGRAIAIDLVPSLVRDASGQLAWASVIARDISQRIEKEVQYPGQIKVTVVRETRAVEYAK